MERIEVIVGECFADEEFRAVMVRFDGERVTRYRRDKVTYTLHRYVEGRRAYFRVHEADETDPYSPVYRLHPYKEDPHTPNQQHPRYYDYGLFDAREIVSRWPLFARHVDFLRTVEI